MVLVETLHLLFLGAALGSLVGYLVGSWVAGRGIAAERKRTDAAVDALLIRGGVGPISDQGKPEASSPGPDYGEAFLEEAGDEPNGNKS